MSVPLASLWILATYLPAQMLIMLHAGRCGAVVRQALQERGTVTLSSGSIA